MAELQRYTRAEVATKTGKNGAPIWIIYKDSVYDCTKYVDEHPAGPDILLDEGGKDVSKTFEEAGHTADAYTILAKYKIGELVEEEKHYDANGKKKKRVVAAQPEGESRGCLSRVTCGLLG
ncbi:cytochrome b5-like [Colias croceus]|uniref:cytochrome b5-like n=1 Tax=Colias crocea TaxID=72248 RepID=UPI001E280A0A|nr:cytochrome b5-like [Colias croceus]